MEITLGNIYWLTTEGEIIHPHVVVALNENSDMVTVVSITTNRKKLNMPGNVVLDIGEGNLGKLSIVDVAKEFSVHKSLLKDYIGTLNGKRMEEIKDGMGFLKRSFLRA